MLPSGAGDLAKSSAAVWTDPGKTRGRSINARSFRETGKEEMLEKKWSDAERGCSTVEKNPAGEGGGSQKDRKGSRSRKKASSRGAPEHHRKTPTQS